MNSPNTKPASSPNLWPHAIILWFVIFASALAAWVSYALRQSTDLVRPDYYEEEIHFQKRLDSLNRTAAVRREIAIRYSAAQGEITLRLPAAHPSPAPVGRVHFYRPADARLDVSVPLAIDSEGSQRINVGSLRAGHWKARVEWIASGQQYFFEETLVLDEGARPIGTPAAGIK